MVQNVSNCGGCRGNVGGDDGGEHIQKHTLFCLLYLGQILLKINDF